MRNRSKRRWRRERRRTAASDGDAARFARWNGDSGGRLDVLLLARRHEWRRCQASFGGPRQIYRGDDNASRIAVFYERIPSSIDL